MPVPLAQRLSSLELFAELAGDELARVAPLVRTRRVKAGQLVVNHFDETREVYFVLEGSVRVRIFSERGRPITFRELNAGDSFGELSAIDGKPRSADVAALTDAEVAMVTADQFLGLLERYPPIALATLRRLSRLVRLLSEQIELLSKQVPVRICHDLLHLAEEGARGDRVHLSPPPKQSDIASRINTHREAVNRVLGDLTREGLLSRGDGKREIIITSVRALRDYADRLEEDRD